MAKLQPTEEQVALWERLDATAARVLEFLEFPITLQVSMLKWARGLWAGGYMTGEQLSDNEQARVLPLARDKLRNKRKGEQHGL